MKAVNLAVHFQKKNLLSAAVAEVRVSNWITVVYTKNHTYINSFQERVNLSNLLTTKKTTPSWQGIPKLRYNECLKYSVKLFTTITG